MTGKKLTGAHRACCGSRRWQSGQSKEMRFYTIAEVADFLGVSTRTVRRWIEYKKLVAHYFGTTVRVAKSDLTAVIAAHRGS